MYYSLSAMTHFSLNLNSLSSLSSYHPGAFAFFLLFLLAPLQRCQTNGIYHQVYLRALPFLFSWGRNITESEVERKSWQGGEEKEMPKGLTFSQFRDTEVRHSYTTAKSSSLILVLTAFP